MIRCKIQIRPTTTTDKNMYELHISVFNIVTGIGKGRPLVKATQMMKNALNQEFGAYQNDQLRDDSNVVEVRGVTLDGHKHLKPSINKDVLIAYLKQIGFIEFDIDDYIRSTFLIFDCDNVKDLKQIISDIGQYKQKNRFEIEQETDSNKFFEHLKNFRDFNVI